MSTDSAPSGGLKEAQRAIADYLLSYIRDNKLPAGAKLPSSNALATMFSVNRNVARAAMNKLAAQGKIYSIQGKGSFVAQNPTVYTLTRPADAGLSEILGRFAEAGESSLLRCSLNMAGVYFRRLFSLGPSEKAFYIEFLRYMGGAPLAVCRSVLPEKLAPGLDKRIASSKSVSDALAYYGYTNLACENLGVSAVMPKGREIKLLSIADDVPILQITSLFSTSSGPLEHYTVKARGDRFRFYTEFSE